MHYSAIENAFYDPALQADLPADAVEILQADYSVLRAGQSAGKRIEPGPDGRPVLAEPGPRPFAVYGAIVSSRCRALRAAAAGTDDPAKLAEYADKAAMAAQLAGGSADFPEVDSALADPWAIDQGITDAAAIGAAWLSKARALRTWRNRINAFEGEAVRALVSAEDKAAYIVEFEASVSALMTEIQGAS